MTIEELGKRTKIKYPGSYDNLNDADLGQRILQKYPQYQNQIEQPAQTQTQQPEKESLITRIGNFFGFGSLAKGLAQAMSIRSASKQTDQLNQQKMQQIKDLEKKIIEAKSRGDNEQATRLTTILRNVSSSPVAKVTDIIGKPVTPKEVIGSAVQTAATALSGGTYGSGKTILSKLLTDVGIGAGLFGGKAAEENKSATDIAKASVLGGTISAAAGPILGIIGKGASKVATGAAENIYKRLIKTPVAQIRAGREDIGTGLLKRGISGNYQKMLNQVVTATNKAKGFVDDIISKNKDKVVNIKPVIDELKNLKGQLQATPGETTTAVDRIIKSISKKDTLTLVEAQTLKQNLQKAVNDAFLKKTTSGITQAQKTAAQALRKEIEKVIPDVVPHNKEIEFGIRAMNRLKETGNLSPSKLRMFTELILGGYGVVANPAITAAVIGERILSTPSVASRAAQSLYKAGSKKANQTLMNLLKNLGLQVGK